MSEGKAAQSAWAFLVIAAAGLVRIGMALKMHPIVHTDSITFFFLRELDTARTPGYPLFLESILTLNDLLSLTPNHLWVIAIGQMFILGILNSWLIYRLADKLTGSRPFAGLMGILYNVNYLVVGFEFQVLTETLTITLLLAVLVLSLEFVRGKTMPAVAAGVLSVLLIYTRTTYLVFFAAIPVLVLMGFFPLSKKKEFLRKTVPVLAVFLIINAVGIAGWSLRNKIAYGYFGMSSLMPGQLRYYTSHLFDRYPPSGDKRLDRTAEIYREEFARSGWQSETVSNFYLRLNDEMNLSEAEIGQLFLKVQMRIIRAYPGEYLKQLPASFMSYYRQYTPYWTARNNPVLFRGPGILPALFRTFFSVYERLFSGAWGLGLLLLGTPLVIFSATWRRKEMFAGWLLVTATIHYNCFVSILSTSAGINNMRYRIAVEPLLLLSLFAAVFYLGRAAARIIRPYPASRLNSAKSNQNPEPDTESSSA
jgi:hypothetical protein